MRFHASSSDEENKQPKSLGMTSAISLAFPKPEDLQRTKELEQTLKQFGAFESERELNQRMQVLGKLNVLVKSWIRDCSVANNMLPEVAEKVGGQIYTFGSYRLGVHGKGADIDALLVAPRNIKRENYFGSFLRILKKQPGVTECRAVEEAFVPVIKMKFEGIEIDLLFARMALKVRKIENFELYLDFG